MFELRTKFNAVYRQYRELDGLPFILIGRVDPRTYDYDEVGPLYVIAINGDRIQAWPEEVFNYLLDPE